MKRFVLLMGLIAGMGAVLFAQQLTVAVSTFEARGGLTKDEADAITEIFISALVADGLVNVVDRSSFDVIISEMKFQASDWTDSERVLQLGKMLKATSIIRGTVMSLGGQVAVTSNILDLNTGKLISSSTLRMGSLDEIFDKMPAFVKDITKFLITARTYNIGDRGPGGGIVFFVEGNVRKEASLFLGEAPNYSYANNIAKTYNGGGYTDWRIPNIDELVEVFKKLQMGGLANYTSERRTNQYWSSTQKNQHSMHTVVFEGGGYLTYEYIQGYQSNSACVLAIRQF
jgi:TolB-like protein